MAGLTKTAARCIPAIAIWVLALAIVPALALAAPAQPAKTPPPPVKAPEPAKQVFGHLTKPAPLAARAIGTYARGCLSGGKMLRTSGSGWEVMRLSRNRYWGHPNLVKFIEKLAADVRAKDGWPGLLVGDMSQPMGGPMLTGHASHQIGLDVDIWLTPAPAKPLTIEDREKLSAGNMVAPDKRSVSSLWGEGQVKVIRRAAGAPNVQRIFVHPALKKALCQAAGQDRGWLNKVRPWYGHDHHFHVRMGCPAGQSGCEGQPQGSAGDGCGEELEKWIKLVTTPPKPGGKPAPPKPPLTLADLPGECAKLVGKAPVIMPASAAPTPAETSAPMEAEPR
jgi:penicillin-insensitive murein endopeptidase